MLKGIDISNNNKGLNLTDTSLLYIMKATQGTSFVDRYCDPWVQWCIANGTPWGFYHFMRPNGGVTEAEFFYRNTRNYFTHGVPILDFEDDRLTDADAESFVWRIHELSGVWPLVYTYSDFINGQGYLKNSWVKDKCGLWLGGLPVAPDRLAQRRDVPLSPCWLDARHVAVHQLPFLQRLQRRRRRVLW